MKKPTVIITDHEKIREILGKCRPITREEAIRSIHKQNGKTDDLVHRGPPAEIRPIGVHAGPPPEPVPL